MTTLDFSPLFRTAIGFDHLNSLLESALRSENQPSFPPYNIELVGEDRYRITLAVAGYQTDELDIQTKENRLLVTGQKKQKGEGDTRYLHKGIAFRNFERQFQLADYVRVTGAKLEDGLLHVELKREIPEAMRPRRIPIGESASDRLIEASVQAKAA
ncbi:small heat shock protein IbpA [Gammaproteobacteria bacterium]